ncbi:MAG: hypothetical protein KAI62_05125 [Actinomycetia bacterium]|nr:hypothetical protein [Actinomycetes bacterium]
MDDYIYSQSVHKDFHGVMNYLIKFIRDNHGEQHMETFFTRTAAYIYKPLIERIKKNNLIEMKKHLEKVFTMEGGKFDIDYKNGEIIFKVNRCPAIWNIKDHNNKIDKDFCKCSTELVNKSIAKECNYNFSVEYDQEKGQCVQRFWEVK